MTQKNASEEKTEADCAKHGWKIEETERLLEVRRKAVDKAEEALVKNDEERLLLMKRRKVEKLLKCATDGDKEQLELELMELERKQVDTYRDERGNATLHICAWHGRLECCRMVIEEYGAKVDVRDQKGWTPLQVASFHGEKKVCEYLMSKGASAEIKNAYNKSAFDLAKDDEVKATLIGKPTHPPVIPADGPKKEDATINGELKTKAKGKAKTSGKAATSSKATSTSAKATSASSSSKAPAAKAKPKAK